MENFINNLREQARALMENEKYRDRVTIANEKEGEFSLKFGSPNAHFFTVRRFYTNEHGTALGSFKVFCCAPWVGEAVIVDKLDGYRLNKDQTLLTILESDDEFFSERDEEGSVNTTCYLSYTYDQFMGAEGTLLRRIRDFLYRGKVLNKFILHFSIEGYTVWTVDKHGKPLKLRSEGTSLEEIEVLIKDVLRLGGVSFDRKAVIERLLAPKLSKAESECSRVDFSFYNVNSELKDIDIDLSYYPDGIIVDIEVDIPSKERVSVAREFVFPRNDVWLQMISIMDIDDYIHLMYNQIGADKVVYLDREYRYLSNVYQSLPDDVKETYGVKEPTLIYPKRTITGETYPYLPFGKGVGLTIRRYEHGYYLDVATPTEPLLYLGIKYDPDKHPMEVFVKDVPGVMELVHSTRLEALAKELDVGLRVSDEILEDSTGKAIEARVTFGKSQAKLEGILFMKNTTISSTHVLHHGTSLDKVIRDFVAHCRGIEDHAERFKLD